MKYIKGDYRFKLAEDEIFHVPPDLVPDKTIVTSFMHLRSDGTLLVRRGYSWDGASGPIKALDRFLGLVSNRLWEMYVRKFLRGSLCHDALCQLLRESYIPPEWLPAVNELMFNILVEDGMSKWRARGWVDTLNAFDFYADPANRQKVLTAP